MSGVHDSEILLLYECSGTNPNGDPDLENRPRMDYATNRVLVSDLRLKRYIRDLLVATFGENRVFVATKDGENVSSTTKVKDIVGGGKGKLTTEDIEKLLRTYIDTRLFGAVFTLKKESESGSGGGAHLTGPIQFSWGFSLHPAEIEHYTITSRLSGREEGQPNMGSDWRVHYALVAFYGVVSSLNARKTRFTEKELGFLDNCLWDSLLQARTRTKRPEPLLYLRVEHSGWGFIGDLRRFVTVRMKKEHVRSLEDLELDFSKLRKTLEEEVSKGRINKIVVRSRRDIDTSWLEGTGVEVVRLEEGACPKCLEELQ